jgi:hypothetical protein
MMMVCVWTLPYEVVGLVNRRSRESREQLRKHRGSLLRTSIENDIVGFPEFSKPAYKCNFRGCTIQFPVLSPRITNVHPLKRAPGRFWF